jgi:ArsR family transcriptional regulator
MDPIYERQAETCKTLANARRLEIIHILASGPREVGRLATEIGVSQPNVSQHLAVMKAAGIVEAERFGREIHYRLADPDVVVACDLMRGVLQRRLARLAGLSATEPTIATTPLASSDQPLATISR